MNKCDHQWILDDWTESEAGEYLDIYVCGLCGEKINVPEGERPE